MNHGSCTACGKSHKAKEMIHFRRCSGKIITDAVPEGLPQTVSRGGSMNKIIATCLLHKILAERGLMQSTFAQQHGLNSPNLCRIMAGQRLPRLPLAKRIAKSLCLKVADIWPDYDAAIAKRRSKQYEAVLAYHKAKRQGRDNRPALDNAQKERLGHDLKFVKTGKRTRPNDPNAVPLADGSMADIFRLQPAKTSDDLLQDSPWCRAQARRMHDYLLRNCAYGVYLELRGIMAAENRLFESRFDHEFIASM